MHNPDMDPVADRSGERSTRDFARSDADPFDPDGALQAARRLEPGLRLAERGAILDQLAADLRDGHTAPEQPGRSWQLELDAERAIDLSRHVRLDEAEALASRVIEVASTDQALAVARATEALGRALAWRGTESASRSAQNLLLEAAKLYADLGALEWQGYITFWRANTIDLQNGDLDLATELMTQALELLLPQSPRRATVLSFYADLLTANGNWSAASRALDEASKLAVAHSDLMAGAYVAWSRAKIASARGDAAGTERLILEAERSKGDWFEMNTGITFLADAAEMLDRVGQYASADRYLARAVERDSVDEFVMQARAVLLARRGDPDEALSALQELSRQPWVERRVVWRHTLFAAYATLRAGRDGAGALAARAIEQSVQAGGIEVALAGEPELVRVLIPLAEQAGSAHAREMLAPGDTLLIRLLGSMTIRQRGMELPLPPGQPAELTRMLALHPHGVGVEEVLDHFFPDVDPVVARRRLRQVLARLRASAGDIVIRDDEQLRLAAAWVDLHAFRQAADRALAAAPDRAVELAHAALAMWGGPPLPADPYAGWAGDARDQLGRRHLALLDLLAEVATRRGLREEALRALALAREEDPYDESRYIKAAHHLNALGRRGAARQVATQAVAALARISVAPPPALRELLGAQVPRS